MFSIRIGTRGSALAIWQTEFVERTLLAFHPDLPVKREIIHTEGDRDQKSSLTQIGGQGVFTKTIEDALLDKRIDIAVHSLKDLPSLNTPGLILGAVPERGPVEDVLISKHEGGLHGLPQKAAVASGSLRRRSQLLHLRPDIRIEDLRGNIHTRLAKLSSPNLDAIVMARAALERLNIKDVSYTVLTTDQMIPAVGQGAIGVQIREADEHVLSRVEALRHQDTFQAVTAERAFLRKLDTGCQFPVGAYAVVKNDALNLKGFVGSEDGSIVLREEISGQGENAEVLGIQLGRRFIDMGATELLSRSG